MFYLPPYRFLDSIENKKGMKRERRWRETLFIPRKKEVWYE